MSSTYKLTVALITMNRAQQMKNAVESCVRSKLPDNTQFVIVDNGSTDETQIIAQELKKTVTYDFIYHREPVNLGAGGGRNICCKLAKGEYIFFLDDDAEIAPEYYESFFAKSIAYLDANPTVATLTTNIVDKVFGERGVHQARTLKIGGLKCVYTFHEGAVFMRRSAFSLPMYMNVVYGGEGVSVSARVLDRGYFNVYDPDIYINHMPKVDKWRGDNQDFMNMQGASNLYVIKKLLYPRIFAPILWAVYKLRIHRYRLKDRSLISVFKKKNKEFCKNNRMKRIKVKTVLLSLKEFGMTTF